MFMFMFGGSQPTIPPPRPAPIDTSAADRRNAELAAQRRILDAQRTGRSSLRIDDTRNPGQAATGSGGLRIQ